MYTKFTILKHLKLIVFCKYTQGPKLSCNQCHYPMCSSKCAETHSQTIECEIIAKNMPHVEGTMKTDYQAILPLRCLLAKNTEEWNYLQMFEDHCKVSSYLVSICFKYIFCHYIYY